MNIVLERFAYMPRSTIGRVFIGEETFFTIEQPYRDNLPFISCVPDGHYVLVPHDTNKKSVPGGKCYALTNPALDVYHYPQDIPEEKRNRARYACLFTHIANYARNVEGCIGVGTKMGEHDTIYDTQSKLWVNGVSSSGKAVKRVLQLLGVDSTAHTMDIVTTAGAVYHSGS